MRSSLRVKDDFNIAIDALIKFLKGIGRLRERQAMRHDLTRPGATGDNQIAQLRVVALIRITAHANGDAFPEERLPGDEQIPTCFDFPDMFPSFFKPSRSRTVRISLTLFFSWTVFMFMLTAPRYWR